jgi:transcriptional regulator with XRE-family HTH domain
VRIREAREARGWTQQTLADKILVDRTAVVRWEHDDRAPTARHRRDLALALGGQPWEYTDDERIPVESTPARRARVARAKLRKAQAEGVLPEKPAPLTLVAVASAALTAEVVASP